MKFSSTLLFAAAAVALAAAVLLLFYFDLPTFYSAYKKEVINKADIQMNTIGKTPEEQFLFPQSMERGERTKIIYFFLFPNGCDTQL